MLRKYDVQLYTDVDARAKARVDPGLATPLCVSIHMHMVEGKSENGCPRSAVTPFLAIYVRVRVGRYTGIAIISR